MDCRLCSVCRRLSKDSLLVAVVLATLVVLPMTASSKELKEEWCKLRPIVYRVGQSGFQPYHIELHQCLGTCDPNLPPTHKSCIPISKEEILLKLSSTTGQGTRDVKVENHTSCECHCSKVCTDSEIPAVDGCGCKSLQVARVGQSGRQLSNSVNYLPYQIGIGIISLFAVCILAICICRNNDRVLQKLTGKCCNSGPQNRAFNEDGTDSSKKETPNGKVVSNV